MAGELTGPDPTATFPGDISVSTVAEPTGALVAGDVTVFLGSAFKAALGSVVVKANNACNLAKREPAATCVINYLKSQAKSGALLDYPLLEAVPDILQHVVDGSLELAKLSKTQLGRLWRGLLQKSQINWSAVRALFLSNLNCGSRGAY